MQFVTRATRSGFLMGMFHEEARIGTVHFDWFDRLRLGLFARRGPFESQVASLLLKQDLPLTYVHMLTIEPAHRGHHHGIQLLVQCRDESIARWPGTKTYAICEPSLIPYWERMGAEFLGSQVCGYHLFVLSEDPERRGLELGPK